MTPAERLAEAFAASHYKSMAELARQAHVKDVTMRAYFQGRFEPPLDVCERIAPLLGYSAKWLFEQVGPKIIAKAVTDSDTKRIISVPVIDEVTAGNLRTPNSQLPEKEWKKVAASGLPPSEYFALKVVGNSMDRFSPEGSLIIVDRNDRRLVSGKAYVFMVNDETTYKLWYDGDPPQLDAASTDPTHRSRPVKRRRDLAVIGRVRRTMLDL